MSRSGLDMQTQGRAAPSGPRKTRVVVRKVGPWSVFRWSLLFYFCVMLIFLVAAWLILNALSTTGLLDSVGKFLGETLGLGCPPGPAQAEVTCVLKFDISYVMVRLFFVGAVFVLIWSVFNMLVTLLYNLVSDVLGGIELTLVERR